MARKPSPRSVECPYHVNARTNNKEWFELDLSEVWEIFESQLFFIHHAYEMRIHAFVLMSNHFHLLMSDPEGNIDLALRWLMTETSREIGRRTNRQDRIWGQRNYKSLIPNYHSYLHAYKYVYRNPVEAGMIHRSESYKYSTLSGLVGKEKLLIPLEEDLLMEDMEKNLQWLNEPVEKDHWECVRKALKKSEFKIGKNKNRKITEYLEKERL